MIDPAPMTLDLDAPGAEPEALFAAADLRGARVLEVGCGDGRLTFRFAAATRRSVALDTAIGELATASSRCPSDLQRSLGFMAATATALPFRDAAFDVALLAWSL